VDWRKRLRTFGSQVRVTGVERPGAEELLIGSKLKAIAWVELGQLSPADVHVQLYYGALNPDGESIEGTAADMVLRESSGAAYRYEGEVECRESGSRGFTVRVIPYHEDAILPYEMPWVQWAE
jgi:glycogen phosphorylase